MVLEGITTPDLVEIVGVVLAAGEEPVDNPASVAHATAQNTSSESVRIASANHAVKKVTMVGSANVPSTND